MVAYFGYRNHVCGIVYLPGFPGADHRYFWTGIRPLCRIRGKMFPHLSACLFSDPIGRSCLYFFLGNRKAGSGCGAYPFKADYPVDPGYAGFRLYNGSGRNFMGRPGLETG